MDWQLQQAKARFSEVVKLAREEGPRTVTHRGQRAAVILSAEAYDVLSGQRPTLVDHMLDGPPSPDDLVEAINDRADDAPPRPLALMYLVDTNVLSEARRDNPIARDWLRSVDAASIHLSVITLGEIMRGVSSKTRNDPRAAQSLTNWLERLTAEHKARLYPVTESIAAEWGRLAALRPRNMANGLIAATALVHGRILVTRNTADFADFSLGLVNPWSQ